MLDAILNNLLIDAVTTSRGLLHSIRSHAEASATTARLVALSEGNALQYEHHRQHVESLFGATDNPALHAQYQRLLRYASG